MTKEQKEAIKYLEYLRDEYRKSAKERKEKGEPIGYGTLEDLDKLNALEIDLVLDLIQEQEKEINKYLEIIANKVIETAKDDLLTEKNIEIEKKDKIIDELAKAFKQDDVRSVQEIKQFYERKVENDNSKE